jgi:uncharacterized protein (DUF1697 family)
VTRLVALLRGVNVGKGNRIAMARLRETAERLGYADVRTYINSGNVVLSSSATASLVERELSEAIKTDFGLDIDVFVRTCAELDKVLDDNPYPHADPSKVTVAFLAAPAGDQVAERLAGVAADDEPYVVAGREIYVQYGRGLGPSKLAAVFPSVVGQSCTVRNIRTLEKVRALL